MSFWVFLTIVLILVFINPFIFPIGSDYYARRWPVITIGLIVINVIVYLVQTLYGMGLESGDGVEDFYETFFKNYGLVPAKSTWYTYITTLFIHGGFGHILGNMIFLWLFGAAVEDDLGRDRFLMLYFAGGIASDFLFIFTTPEGFNSEMPLVGASGAISACLGAYLILLPWNRIEFYYLLRMFFIIPVASGSFFIPAWLVMSWWFVRDFVLGILDLLAYSGFDGGGVAVFAHVGGFLAGASIAYGFRRNAIQHRVEAVKKIKACLSRPEIGGGYTMNFFQGKRQKAEWKQTVRSLENKLGVHRGFNSLQEFFNAVESYRKIEKDMNPNFVLSDQGQWTIADQLYRKEDFEGSLKACRKYLINYPKGRKVPEALHLLGKLLAQRGQQNDALDVHSLIPVYFEDHPIAEELQWLVSHHEQKNSKKPVREEQNLRKDEAVLKIIQEGKPMKPQAVRQEQLNLKETRQLPASSPARSGTHHQPEKEKRQEAVPASSSAVKPPKKQVRRSQFD